MDWIALAQEADSWWAFVIAAINLLIKQSAGEVVDCPTTC